MKESIFNVYLEINNENYCFNSFTKAIVKLKDVNYIKAILRDELKQTESDKRHLIKNGFIVNNNINEMDILDYIYKKNYFNNQSRGIILMPTIKCNFNCPYCFEKDIEFNEVDNYFDIVYLHILDEIEKVSNIHLAFFGGEPLIQKKNIEDFMEKVLLLCNKKRVKLKTSMVTNGSRLDENIIKILGKSNCQYIQITFDGNRTTHNKSRIFKNGELTYDLLIHKMEMLAVLSRNFPSMKPILRLNIESQSLDEVKEMLQSVDKRCRSDIFLLIRRVFSTCYYSSNSTKNNNTLTDYYEAGKNLGYNVFKNRHYFSSCEACSDINSYHILPDLTLAKCVNDLNYEAVKVGKLQDNGTIKWNPQRLVNWFNSSDFIKDTKCNSCVKAATCLGGCILYNLKTGNRNCLSTDQMIANYL